MTIKLFSNRKTRKNFSTLLLAASLAIGFPGKDAIPVPAFAQGNLHTWNTHKREQSEKLLSSAMTWLKLGETKKASELLLQACNEDPTDAAPASLLGLTYSVQGKYSQAMESLRKAYELGHGQETLLCAGFNYYLQHDYDSAIASWKKVIDKDPRKAEAYACIGFAQMRKGDFAEADKSFRKAIEGRPSSQIAYEGLAWLNYLSGDFKSARNAAEHAQSIRPYHQVLLIMAKLDYLQGAPEAGRKRVSEWARSSADTKVERCSMTEFGFPPQHDFGWDPFLSGIFDNGYLLMARAEKSRTQGDGKQRSLARKGCIEKALAEAKETLSAADNDLFAKRELALLELTNGDYAAAEQHFQQLLQSYPGCKVDWLHLARALFLQGKSGEASYAAGEFRRLRPEQKIADAFMDLSKGQPVESTASDKEPPGKAKKQGNESGF